MKNDSPKQNYITVFVSEAYKINKSKALELGFQKVGISSPELPLKNNQYYDDWLMAGKNGNMQWLDRRKEVRKDIYQYFPEVQSVISVAINYFTGNAQNIAAKSDNSVNFSNYAWGTDYHAIVKDKLNLLLKYIQVELNQNIKGLTCVDTSPLMEKQWAQRSGIGWQGKHTILINEDYGSWLLFRRIVIRYSLEI